MIDIENLIIEVERYECLWRVNCKNYMDRDMKQSAWIEVSKVIFPNWEQCSNAEQEKQTEELKRKWKNIRDNYTRDVNDSRRDLSGSAAPKKNKKYAYADILGFLQPVVKKRKTTGNMNHDLDISVQEEDINIEQNNASADESLIDQISKQPSTKKSKQNTPFQDSLLEAILNPPFLSIPPPENNDPDKAFLLSFLPDIKKLNDGQKMELKFQFLQALKNITNNTNISSPIVHSYHNNGYNPLTSSPFQHVQQSDIYPHSSMLQNTNSYYSLPAPNHTPQVNVNHTPISQSQTNNPSQPSNYTDL